MYNKERKFKTAGNKGSKAKYNQAKNKERKNMAFLCT